MVRIRDATADEAPILEALQRRSSDVWPECREQLAANPDAIAVPQTFVDNGGVRVAVDSHDRPIGFSVVIAADGAIFEIDGLFVNPAHMQRGVGRALVEDAVTHAAENAAVGVEVTAGPAQEFYERVGFTVVGDAQTRFGPAVRMRRELHR